MTDTRHIAKLDTSEYAAGILAVENMAKHGLDSFMLAVKRTDGSYSHYEIKLRSDNVDEISSAINMAVTFHGVRVH